MNLRKNIAVIGAGVSGLTTAFCLRQAGHAVRMFADKPPLDTTSAVAAAIWFPYRVGPVNEALAWSRRTFEVLKEMASEVGEAAGISMVDLLLLEDVAEPWWIAGVPDGHARCATAGELLRGFPGGWVVNVPMVETQVYLPWLLGQVQGAGVELEIRHLQGIDEIAPDYDLVVNCTGLGARELVGDARMHAIRGQILRAEAVPGAGYVVADDMPGMAAHEATYIFPRRDGIILGGTAVQDDEGMDWDVEMGEGILRRCERLLPGLCDARVLSRLVGLRPGRDEIRLEREDRVIHNYGHGGAGYTVSWGCAEAVVAEVAQSAKLLEAD